MSKPDTDELVEIMLKISELMRQMKVEVMADMPDAEILLSIRDRNAPERAHLMHSCCGGCLRNEIDLLYRYSLKEQFREEFDAEEMDRIMAMLRDDDQVEH